MSQTKKFANRIGHIPTDRSVFWALGASLALALVACNSTQPAAQPEQVAPSEASESVTGSPTAEGPGPHAPSEGEGSAQSPEAPSEKTGLFELESSPYAYHPLAWRYRSERYVDRSLEASIEIVMTTTRNREMIEGHGLAFMFVVMVDQSYQSRVALLSENGLTISEPNAMVPGATDWRRATTSDAPDLIGAEAPTWPLPAVEGCDGEWGDYALPFGSVRGLMTTCRDYAAHIGRAQVRTLWVPGVGFAFREIITVRGGVSEVYRDVLESADVAGLAQPAEGEPQAL